MHSIKIAAVRLALFCFRLIPVRLAGAIGAGLGRLGYLLDRRHRRTTLQNLALIYPERSARERRRLAVASFAELGRTLFELPHVYMRSKSFLLSRIEFEGDDAFRKAMNEGNGVILVACHHSNWELGALMFSMMGYPSDMIYRPLSSPALESVLKQARERFGAHLRSRREGLRWLPRAMKEGHCLAIMIDQHLSNGEHVPFLGHPASTTTLPAALASKYDIPVFGVVADRIGHSFRFRGRFWPIELPPSSADESGDNIRSMQLISESFTPVIHQRPELWLWSHRRWRPMDAKARETQHGAS